MPTKQITVCATCGKVSCDGGLWKWVSLQESGSPVDLTTRVLENQVHCTLWYGHQKALRGKAVDAEVDLSYPNWVRPAILRVRKIED